MYPVRNSVKAIIVRDGSLLCIRKATPRGDYYILPGGGQEKDETFPDALRRECMEEIGAEVEIGQLRYIREYIAKNHEFRIYDTQHQVEYMFECTLRTEPDPGKAGNMDDGQTGIEWIDLDGEKAGRIYPGVLAGRVRDGCRELYWGDVN